MGLVQKDILFTTIDGQKVALPVTYDTNGDPQLISDANPFPVKGSVQLSGSKVALLSDTTGVTIATGSYSQFIINAGEAVKYSALEVGFRETSNAQMDYKVTVFEQLSSGETINEKDVISSATGSYSSGKIDIVGERIMVRFYNNSATPKTIKRYIGGAISNNSEFTIKKSRVALPVDIQFSNLSELDALLVKGVQRDIEVVNFYSSQAIRDTATLTSTKNLKKYKSIHLFAMSTLNQPVDLLIGAGNPTGNARILTYTGTGFTADERRVTIDQPNDLYDLNTKLKWLDRPFNEMSINAVCNTAPTSGSLNVFILGVPN